MSNTLSAEQIAATTEGFGASYNRDDDCWHFYAMPNTVPLGLTLKGLDAPIDFIIGLLRVGLTASSDLTALRARVEELEGALKPFETAYWAQIEEHTHAAHFGGYVPIDDDHKTEIEMLHLRLAAASLTKGAETPTDTVRVKRSDVERTSRWLQDVIRSGLDQIGDLESAARLQSSLGDR